jgi:hypothetical protein
VIASFAEYMAQQACNTFIALKAALQELAFPGNEARLDIVVSFLEQQDVDVLRELAGFPKVSNLEGAGTLTQTEAAFIEKVAAQQKAEARIRNASVSAVCVPVLPSEPVEKEFRKLDEFMQRRDACGNIGARVGPMRFVQNLQNALQNDDDRIRWLEEARLEAILGSCKDSMKSVKSGIRCYLAFATHVLKKEGNKLPPTVNDLLRFSASFRCS